MKMPKYYLTLNVNNEVKKRIAAIEQIKSDREDAIAELKQLRQMNPNIKSKGAGDCKSYSSGTRVSDKSNDIIINMIAGKERLENDVIIYDAIIRDFNRGWKTLSSIEREVLSSRFKDNMKQKSVAKELNMDRKTIYNIEREALEKMAKEIVVV